MKEHREDDMKYSIGLFKETLKSIKAKSGNKFEFITNGGSSLHEALNKLFNVVWESEKIPDSWYDSP